MSRAKKELWVQKAFSKNPGALHKSLNVPEDKKIPEKKLEKAAHSKNPLLKKRAVLAENAKHFHRKNIGGSMMPSKKMTFKGSSRSR